MGGIYGLFDAVNMINLMGVFSQPSGYDTWSIWKAQFEYTAKNNNIEKVIWAGVLLNMVRGKAKVQVEA